MKTQNQGPAAPYHVRLQAEDGGLQLKLGEVWAYRDLVLLMTRKTFTMTYQQTILGPLWIILNPVLSSLIYMFIFGHVAAIGTDGVPQILFYFLSSSVWGMFAYSLTSNASTFVSNANLFGKVYFPRLVMPLSEMLVSCLRFLVQLAIVLVLLAIYAARGDVSPEWKYFIFLPFLFLQVSFLGMSAGVLLSSLTTRYRDLMHLVNIGVNLLMYGSAVVYPLSAIPEGPLRTLIRHNPVTGLMELIRRIMLGRGEADPGLYLGGLAFTVLLFVLGTMIFNRVQRNFADTV